ASVGLVLFSLMVSRTPLASGATTGRQRQNELSAADAPDQVRKKTGLVKPGNRGQVEDDSSQEDELERRLHGLVAELLLGDQRAGPPSEKVCKVEAGFRGALRIALRRDLVRPVHEVRQDAQREVRDDQQRRDQADDSSGHTSRQRAQTKSRPWHPGRSAPHFDSLAGVTHLPRVGPPLRVKFGEVGDHVADNGPARAPLELVDMDECASTAAMGHYEAEALVVVPVRDPACMSYWCFHKRTRGAGAVYARSKRTGSGPRFRERTTTVPASLSCQPCFFGSNATQMIPRNSGIMEMK